MMASPTPPGTVPAEIGLALSDLIIKGQTDVNGRLLLEDAAPKTARRKAFKAGIPMKPVHCSYQDTPSRLGGMMNQPAYEALRHDTAAVLDGFAWLATHYWQRIPIGPNSVRGLFDVSYLGLTLPLLLFHRTTDRVGPYGRMPSHVASLFKASRGVFSVAVDMLNRLGPTATIAAVDIVKFADAQGHLKRPETDRACAAPTRLIERTLAVILTGEGADPNASDLGTLTDFETLWTFYRLQDSFSEVLSAYRHHFGQQLAEAVEPTNGQFAAATKALVDRANTTQAEVNRVLGRTGNGPPIGFEEILALL
ncbi:MAG: hypothetical protein ACRDRT_08465 [Pseudonocardiaceae bacterium]